MNRILLRTTQVLLVVLLFSFTTSNLKAPVWRVSGSHSNVSFEINHFFTPVQGHFSDFKAELLFDSSDLKSSSVSFTVQAASIKTDSDRRDKHLRSSDFFDTEEFPEMTFISKSISKSGKGFVANGDFTLKGITKSVKVPFKVLGMGDHPSKEGVVMLGIKGEFTINRNDYNVGTGDFVATTVLGNEVTITVVLEASRKK